MKSVKIQISDLEFEQLGLKKNTLSLSEMIEIIEKKINKRRLERSVQLADQYGLSQMTLEEIDNEVQAHRNAQADS